MLISGIGFMLTTAVTIAGGGRFDLPWPPDGPGMMNVAWVDGCGIIELY